MKAILVVLDGVADRPVPALGGKTPLESAYTPALDFLAKSGSSGMIDVLGGVAPESDAAVLSLLGYDPHKFYTGRGPLEAVGIGMKMKPGMLALRCNFATSSDGVALVDRRVARSLSSRESAVIAEAVNRKVKLKGASFIFRSSVAHRGVLLIKSVKRLSSKISNTDPAYSIGKSGIPEALSKFDMRVNKSCPLDSSSSSSLAAALVNDFTRQTFGVLKDHPLNKRRVGRGLLPANVIISRDAGDKLPKLYSLSKRYERDFAILADMPLEVGIGMLSGMAVVRLPLPSFTRKDYGVRVSKALSALKKFGFLYIHIKGPDLFGHDGDFVGKKACVEDIDRFFLSPLLKKIDLDDTLVAVTSDHSTPCLLKGHSSDPVPFVLCGANVPKDDVSVFGERASAFGGFGRIRGVDLMPLIVNL